MSEDVKPKRLWISKRKAPILFSEINVGTMTYAFSYKPRDSDILAKPGDIVPFIELEPTLQLMKDMGEALHSIWGHTEDCTDSEEFFDDGETCECGFILVERAYEKYRKFLELIHEKN